MNATLRDRLSVGIVLTAIALGLGALLVGPPDPGLQVGREGDRVVVQRVAAGSEAQRDGVLPGMVVVAVNGVTLLELPGLVYDEDGVDGAEVPPSSGPLVQPERPTPIPISDEALDALLQPGIRYLEAIQPWDLERGSAGEWAIAAFSYENNQDIRTTGLAFAIGVILLVGGAWWVRTGQAGPSLQPLALALAAAVATPFLVRPLEAAAWSGAASVASVIVVAAMLPLAVALVELIEGAQERRLVAVAVATCAVVAVLASFATPISGGTARGSGMGWLLMSAIPLLPGIAAAGPIGLPALQGAAPSTGRLLRSAEFAVAGATPMFALGTDTDPYVFPLALWLIVVALAGRFTIRPLARLATRAALQRDLVVAATEAERARVAADIHDDALQELSLLVRRLDSTGDEESAEIARTVADRLRAICGDLRLPILDDLGVGPALDWLVLRIERLAGGEVRLERSDGTRPPPEVELAMFRVAQEALANAVKHGRPPIIVRYRASEAGASLSIDDAGPGIAPEAGAVAEREGRFGLLNMQQRAEQIGAILDIRQWPGGGTHVALEWRPQ